MATAPVSAPVAGPEWALQREFARLLVLAVLLPAMILSALFIWRDAASRRTRVGESLVSTTKANALEVDDFLRTHRAAVEVVAERRSREGSLADRERWIADLSRLRRHYPALLTMLVADAGGGVLVSVPLSRRPVPGVHSVADRAYFTEPRRTGRGHVSGVFRGRVQGDDILVAISAPLTLRQRFAGVVEASIHVDAFARLRGQRLLDRGYESLLLDRSRKVIHASNGLPYKALDVVNLEGAGRRQVAAALGMHGPRLLRGVLRDGGDAYAMTVPLEVGWDLVLMEPTRILDRELRRNALGVFGLLALVAAGVLMIGWRQMARLNDSLHLLLERLHRFALDEAPPPIVPASMPTELVPLVEAMNQLQTRLGAAYSETSRSLEEQRRLRESLEDAVGAREREIAQRTVQLRNAVAELDRLSRTDALTGCLNYRGFREIAENLCSRAHAAGQPLSVLALDVDHFKAYNDHYGHQQGDTALQRLAGAVRSALYHHEDIMARPGGEEFVVFLPGTTLEQGVQVAERVRASVAGADIVHAGSPVGALTVSIGIACLEPGDGGEPGPMLARADEALYRAKRDGRNRHSR